MEKAGVLAILRANSSIRQGGQRNNASTCKLRAVLKGGLKQCKQLTAQHTKTTALKRSVPARCPRHKDPWVVW